MSERSDRILVADMLEAVERIQEYTAGMDFAAFVGDRRTVDAVLRNLHILGEAANRVSSGVRALSPDIEWQRIIRSRHIVVHDYFGVDDEVVWRIIEVHLPPLRISLQSLFQKIPEL